MGCSTKYGTRNREKLREVLSDMLEEATFERQDYKVVEDMCRAILIKIEAYANCKEFARTGLDKRRWYEATDYISAETIESDAVLGVAGSSPPPASYLFCNR